MQTSGFFNAVNNNGVYDRTYNANSYSDNLAVIISNGVLRSASDDLRVTVSGMTATVAAGRAWISGRWYYNDTPYTFASVSAPVSGTRLDRVFLRLDTSVASRSISLVYRQGTAAASPTAPAPERTGNIYELCLATITVAANSTAVTVTDNRANADLCGWVYSTSGDDSFYTTLDNDFNSWFTGVRTTLSSVTQIIPYYWRTVLQTASSTVVFNIPQYDPSAADYIEVYVNGMLELAGVDYTLNGATSTITFGTGGGGTGTKIAGTEIVVKLTRSIDGTGIDTITGDVTALQNQVDDLTDISSYNYVCTGTADNIALSDIAQAFLNGTGAYAGTASDAQLTIHVYGTPGITAPYAGSGTTASPYRWFSFGLGTSTNKRLYIDFSACSKILVPLTGSSTNYIFYGNDCRVIGANMHSNCYAAGCAVEVFNGRGDISARDCYFNVITTGIVFISRGGTFIDCEGYVSNSSSHAYCFVLMDAAKPLVVIGGKYRAYTASAAAENVSCVVFCATTQTSSACTMYGVSCPTVAVSNFYQKHCIHVSAGYTTCSGLITALPSSTSGATASITGTIPLSKV